MSSHIVDKHSIYYKAVYQNYDWMFDKYIINGMTEQEIADLCGASLRVIKKWCCEKFRLNNRTKKYLIKLNSIQKDLVIGNILGDGHITKGDAPMFIVSHTESQKEYLYWEYGIMKNLCLSPTSYYDGEYKYIKGKPAYTKPSYRFGTVKICQLKEFNDLSIKEVIDSLNNMSLSIFMLDDGYYSSSMLWELCVASFSEEERDYFIRVLYNKFGIKSKKKKDSRYIVFNRYYSDIINNIIISSIPNNIDIIKTKLRI